MALSPNIPKQLDLPSAKSLAPLPDSTYRAEALSLLEDEFTWFSSDDIANVFQSRKSSFIEAWLVLYEADGEGCLATVPIQPMESPRKPECKSSTNFLQSKHLLNEQKFVEAWRRQKERDYQVWADSLFFSVDQNGKEQLLDSNGAQVMMEWEKPYMEGCIDALNIGPDCHVLEIGFGLAYSAERIQKANPRTHTIIECSEVVLKRLRCWAANKPGVNVVAGTWQQCLPQLGMFDCIFFDDYGAPGMSENEMDHCCQPRYRDEYKEVMQEENGSHILAFLRLALRWHSKPGTRISAYLHYPIEDGLSDMDVDVDYTRMLVTVPENCNYFPTNPKLCEHALIPLFTKRDDLDERTTHTGDSFSNQSCSRSASRTRSRSRSRSRN